MWQLPILYDCSTNEPLSMWRQPSKMRKCCDWHEYYRQRYAMENRKKVFQVITWYIHYYRERYSMENGKKVFLVTTWYIHYISFNWLTIVIAICTLQVILWPYFLVIWGGIFSTQYLQGTNSTTLQKFNKTWHVLKGKERYHQ